MPTLAPVVADLSTVPDALRPFYTEQDGQHVLCLDAVPPGLVPQADVVALQAQVAHLRLHRAIEDAFLACGGRPNARGFIAMQADAVFDMDGDTVVAKADVFSTSRPGTPLTVVEWLGQMRRTYDFAFQGGQR